MNAAAKQEGISSPGLPPESDGPRYVVSACLAGEPCRYDGKPNLVAGIRDLVLAGRALPVCPEVLGGLSVPRAPCELVAGEVVTPDGRNCTDAFRAGAAEGLRLAREGGCIAAVLKSRSPSCGCGQIYDGTFSHTIVEGDGIFAAVLRAAGLSIVSEENFAGADVIKAGEGTEQA